MSTAGHVHALHVPGRPLVPSKLYIQVWGSGPHVIRVSLGPIRVNVPNGISIGSAVFAGLTIVADRQTDRAHYSVCSNRPNLYVVLRYDVSLHNVAY